MKGSEESKISMYIEIEYDDFFQNSGSPITLLYSFNKVHKFKQMIYNTFIIQNLPPKIS